MRDLFLLTHQRATLPHGHITTSTLDSVTSTLYVGTRDLQVVAWDLKQQQIKWTVPINGDDDELIPRTDTFLSCTYLSEFESLHLITSMGHMLLLNVITYDIEHVGSVPPITASAWSPDQEIITFATQTGTLFLMTKEWEVLYEIQIARDVTGLPSSSTPIITSLTWRGDGQYVAANVIVGDQCHLIVYNRDGECQSRSAPVARDATGLTAGHSSLLTWRPSGNLITSSQRRIIGTTTKHEIIFYERNGLRHGEFLLRGEDVKIWEICWNSDSEVLALIVQHPTTHICSLQLWYQNNYHWYLKYQLDISTTTTSTTSTSPILLCWDPEQAMRLCLIETETGMIRWMEFCFDVHASTSDDRSVAVIDGTSLLFTPLARMVMPPPMSDHQLVLSSPIVSLSFYDHDMMILTSSRQIIYASDVETIGKTKYDMATLILDGDEHFRLGDVRGLIWIQKGVNTHTLFLIESHLPTGSHVSRDMLIEMNVSVNGDKMEMKEMMRTAVPEGVSVLRTYPRLSDHYIAVETTDGRVYKYNPTCYTSSIPSLIYFATLPTPCSWLGVTYMGNVELCIGRDIRSRLYIDQTLGQQNAMFFLDREQNLEYNLAPETRMDPHAFRFVERGSSIVTVIPHHDRPRVVLQMPRGNLETISPRALTLASINTCLSNRDYHTALSTARTQRIDLNLLVDHNEDDFCNHAEEFVRSVDNVDHINLFLSSLTNDNVIKTQFPGYKPLPPKDEKKEDTLESPQFDDRDVLEHNLTSTPSHDLMDIHDDDMDDAESHARHHHPHAKKGASEYAERKEREQRAIEYEAQLAKKNVKKYDDTSKINRVCRVVREALEKIDAKKFTLSILTCYVKSSPPNLPATLTLIKSMRDAERAQGISTTTTLQKEQKEVSQRENKSHKYGSALGALKYVIFLCDVKQLYRVALSMYDFDLVMMVAQQSQRDPKEYLPMLKKMQDMASTPYFQHYSIDLHLKRYDVACINLCEALKRQEIPSEYFTTHLLELIRKQRLYLIALHHLRPTDITRLSRNIYIHGTSGVDTRAQRQAALAQLAMLGDVELPITSHMEEEEEDVKTATTTTTTSTTTTISQDTLTQYYLTVLSHYASYQQSHGRTTQAAIAYGICGNIDACIHAWKDGGDYRQALSLAYHNKWEQNKIQALSYQLVTILQQQSRYIDASTVLTQYCHDVDQAVVVLLSAEEWSECLRVCYTHGRADLIETHVQPELKKTYQRYIKHIAAQMKRYEYSTRRIRIVRRVKLMFPVMADVPHDDRDDDLQSIVSGFSNISSSTRASGVSGVSSILSQASRASSVVSTTSSIFSVIPQNYGTMTPEEKQQEKRLKRIARKRINKVVKEGHPQEEEHLMREIIESTPTLRYQEKIQHLIRILIQFGHYTDAQQLDTALTEYSALVTREESIPMPMLPDPTPEQRTALLAFWNWPAAAHPPSTDPLINTLENQRLDFLSNAAPTQYVDESQPRRHANSKRGKPKQRHGVDDEEEDDQPVVTQRKKEFWELDEDERAE